MVAHARVRARECFYAEKLTAPLPPLSSFHPCVRYSRYERESVVSFVPPDGNFELVRARALAREAADALYT